MGQPVVFFDGLCGLCDGFIRWITKHDRKDAFRFAPLQGATAAAKGLSPSGESIVFEDERGMHRRSTAAIRIISRLGGGWKLISVFLILPASLRDNVYDLIARNRYRWFGKKEHCRIPTQDERPKFLP